MSVNITVSVPFKAALAVTQASDPTKTADAIASITRAVIKSIKKLPLEEEPGATANDEEDNLSVLSFDSNEPADAPRPLKKPKTAVDTVPKGPSMQVFVKDLLGHTDIFEVTPHTTINHLKELIWVRTGGYTPAMQRLIFDEQKLQGDRTLEEVRSAASSR